jgi:hypothetical protein
MTSELEEKFQLLHKRVRINLQTSLMLLNEAKDLIVSEPDRYNMLPTLDEVVALNRLISDVDDASYSVGAEVRSVWQTSSMDC